MRILNIIYNLIKIIVIKINGKFDGKMIQPGINKNAKLKSYGGAMKIGKKVTIRDNCYISASNGKLEIGDNVFINQNAYIVSKSKIIIGKNTIIAPNVVIVDHDHDYKDNILDNEFLTENIKIGNNVWIGANCTILRGTELGNNCVVAAGTIVKGKFENNSLIYQKRLNIIKKIK